MALTQEEINEVMQQLQPIIAKALNDSATIEQAQSAIQQGVTQYIGARYVPLFADPINWDKSRAYEPLTIVLYQGNSFTTIQYTPAGIDINNDAFWAETGNYNAQIEQYRRETLEAKREAERAYSAANAAQATADSNKVAIAQNSKDIDANTKRIDNIGKRVFGFIGDSFSDPSAGYDWVGTDLPKWLGSPVVNASANGAGFIGGKYASSVTFIKQLQSLHTSNPNITDLIIYGGNNDYPYINNSTLTSAIKAFVVELNNLFPTVNCHFFVANFNRNVQEPITWYTQQIVFAFSSLKDSAIKFSIDNNADSWMFDINDFKSASDSHPSDATRQYIGMLIASSVNGGNMTSAFTHSITAANDIHELSNSKIEFKDGCIVGAALTFKMGTPSAGHDVFTWNSPLNFVKPISVIANAGQNIPCLLYIGKKKAVLYISSDDISKITSSTLIYAPIPTTKWESEIV